MKTVIVVRLLSVVVICSLAGITGCSSVMTRTGPAQGYYSGTCGDAAILTDRESGWMMISLAAVDLPFSIIMDTLLLPWDYLRASEDKTTRSPRERILRIEKHTAAESSRANN